MEDITLKRYNLSLTTDQHQAVCTESQRSGLPKTEILRNLVQLGLLLKNRGLDDLLKLAHAAGRGEVVQ